MDPFIKRVLWGFMIVSVVAFVLLVYMILAGQDKVPSFWFF